MKGIASNRLVRLWQKRSSFWWMPKKHWWCFFLTCDLQIFIKKMSLFEYWCQKLGIGLCKTKISDQVIELFLVGVPWISLPFCASIFWINDFILFWIAVLFWTRLGHGDDGCQKVWIYYNMWLLASSTFGRVHHREEAVIWMVNWFPPNSGDCEFHGSIFPSVQYRKRVN